MGTDWHIQEASEAHRKKLMYFWRDSFRESYAAGPIPMDDFNDIYGPILNRIMERPKVTVRVALNPEDHDQIYGFSVTESGYPWPVVHYCYVKSSFRRYGIMKDLLHKERITNRTPFRYTFKTEVSPKLCGPGKTYARGRWNPMLPRFTKSKWETDGSVHGEI